MDSQPKALRCTIVPEAFLQQLAVNESVTLGARQTAQKTLELDNQLSGGHDQSIDIGKLHSKYGSTRFIYNARNKGDLPGDLAFHGDGRSVHGEGNFGEDGNHRMGVLYHRLQHVSDFFEKVFNYKLMDGQGTAITATAHFQQGYANCYWDINDRHLVVGDGDSHIACDFTASIDIIAHELTHGIISHTSNPRYEKESGALNEHLADVFGVLCMRHRNRTPVDQARDASSDQTPDMSWTIGSRAFQPFLALVHDGLPNSAGTDVMTIGPSRPGYLHSLADPSTSLDPQPWHYTQYIQTPYDNYGVHDNSGIPNFAFYKAATLAGGPPWDGVGQAWFRAMIDPNIGQECSFAEFAAATIVHSRTADPALEAAIAGGWAAAGVVPTFPDSK